MVRTSICMMREGMGCDQTVEGLFLKFIKENYEADIREMRANYSR